MFLPPRELGGLFAYCHIRRKLSAWGAQHLMILSAPI